MALKSIGKLGKVKKNIGDKRLGMFTFVYRNVNYKTKLMNTC